MSAKRFIRERKIAKHNCRRCGRRFDSTAATGRIHPTKGLVFTQTKGLLGTLMPIVWDSNDPEQPRVPLCNDCHKLFQAEVGKYDYERASWMRIGKDGRILRNRSKRSIAAYLRYFNEQTEAWLKENTKL